jgi:DNA-binding beta-propeller fold protein YncE
MGRIYAPIFREIERYSVSNSIAKSVRMVVLIPFISVTLILSSIFSPGFAADGQFDFPYGVAIDPKGNVFVADTHNHRIQEFTNTGKFIREWGDRGTGNGQFDFPRGIEIDPKGNVFVADSGNDRIQKFTNTGKYIRQWNGNEGGGNITSLSPSRVPMLGLATGAHLE